LYHIIKPNTTKNNSDKYNYILVTKIQPLGWETLVQNMLYYQVEDIIYKAFDQRCTFGVIINKNIIAI
jgi:hypothetical protein